LRRSERIFFYSFFVAQGISFIRANSQTIDEAAHLGAGYSYLATGDFRLDSEHPPLIKKLQALPLFLHYKVPFDPDPHQWNERNSFVVGHDFLYKSALGADRMLALARLVTLGLGGCLLVVIGLWAYRLWGSAAALLAMSIACFEPNLIAHSSLVTTDIGVTLFIFLVVYLLWEYVNSPTWARLAVTGICTGMALSLFRASPDPDCTCNCGTPLYRPRSSSSFAAEGEPKSI
jgi:predicted membrane-bound dolichyl-phosphate-mannose-protein mannosyltransferase